MSPFMILILIAILSTVKLEKEKPQVYCGRALANVRMLLCYEHIQKRSTDEHMTSMSSYFVADKKIWPKTSSQVAQDRALEIAILGKTKSNIIKKCCYQPCYTEELLALC